MLILRNLNLISVQSWTYLAHFQYYRQVEMFVKFLEWCIKLERMIANPTYLLSNVR